MNLCQNVCHHEKRTDLEVGHVGSESRPLAYYLKFKTFYIKVLCKVFQEPIQMMDLVQVWHDR